MKPKPTPKIPTPPFEVRRPRPDDSSPQIMPVYVRLPRSEIESFHDWMRRNRIDTRRERARLAKAADEARREIAAIDALLGGQQSLSLPGRIAPGGLRAAIMTTLTSTGHPMKPKEVTTAVLATGFKSGGKTELPLRVGNELWRLYKAGKLRRDAHRGYSAPKEG